MSTIFSSRTTTTSTSTATATTSTSDSIIYLQSNSFPLIFPLPFRILFLGFLGLLLYALVLHSLDYFNIQFDFLFETGIDSQQAQQQAQDEDELTLPLTFNPQSSQSQINQFPRPFHLKSTTPSPERSRRSNLQQALLSKLSTLSSNSSSTTTTKLYSSIYYSALSIGLLTSIGLITFRFLTNGNDPKQVSNLSSLSLIWLIFVIILSISSNGHLVSSCLPFQAKFKSQRRQFRQSLSRIIFGGLNDPPSFADILLADVLTSYARVLGDLWLSICLSTVAKHGLATQSQEVGCYKNVMVPLITSLPYAFRLRQCLAEYYSRSSSSNPRRSLLNALKYATAFPMIALSVFMVNSPASDDAPEIHQEASPSIKSSIIAIPATYQFWLLSILINSLYSFWWDVTNDWSFALLRPTAWSSTSPKLSISGARSPPPPLAGPTFEPERLPRRNSPASLQLSTASRVRNHSPSYMPLTPDLTLPNHNMNQESFSHRFLNVPSSVMNTYHSNSSRSIPNPTHHFTTRFLRPELLFRPILIYIILIGINLLLRLAWVIRLIGPLQEPSELIGFGLEVLEILRRSLWCFLRFESEMIKQIKLDHQLMENEVGEEFTDEELDEHLDEELGLGHRGMGMGDQFGGGGKSDLVEVQEGKEDGIEVDGSLIIVGRNNLL